MRAAEAGKSLCSFLLRCLLCVDSILLCLGESKNECVSFKCIFKGLSCDIFDFLDSVHSVEECSSYT